MICHSTYHFQYFPTIFPLLLLGGAESYLGGTALTAAGFGAMGIVGGSIAAGLQGDDWKRGSRI